MDRNGDLDQLTGQRAAFPINELNEENKLDSEVLAFLKQVRSDSVKLSLENIRINEAKRSKEHEEYNPNKRKHLYSDMDDSNLTAELNYDEQLPIGTIHTITKTIYPFDLPQRRYNLLEFFTEMQSQCLKLDPESVECPNKVAWRIYAANNSPVPLDRSTSLKVLSYLTECLNEGIKIDCKVSQAAPNFIKWCWAILLRMEQPLVGDEIAQLRTTCRVLKTHDELLAKAFTEICCKLHGQLDLLN